MRDVQPNTAYVMIAALETQKASVSVVTQNIDGLHAMAGSTHVHELHGNIFQNCCFGCRRIALPSIAPQPQIPRCLHCGGYVRPAVVWFKERISEPVWRLASRAIVDCDVLVIVGTSGEIYPAAGLPNLARGKRIVVINPQPTALDEGADWVIRKTATEGLAEFLSVT